MPSQVIERGDPLAMKKLKVLVDWIWIGPDTWLDLSHVLGIGLLDEKPRRAMEVKTFRSRLIRDG